MIRLQADWETFFMLPRLGKYCRMRPFVFSLGLPLPGVVGLPQPMTVTRIGIRRAAEESADGPFLLVSSSAGSVRRTPQSVGRDPYNTRPLAERVLQMARQPRSRVYCPTRSPIVR